jgi:hypothetical protein
MECRRHALRCAELAMAARTPQLKTMFLELSKNWKALDLSLLQTIEFRTLWGKVVGKAGIESLNFHDLYGSTVTRLALEGLAASRDRSPRVIASRMCVRHS